MRAAPHMTRLVDYEASTVNRKLSLHGVPLPFPAVVRPALYFVLGPGNLLLRGVGESLKPWKQRFNFLYALQSLGFVVQPLGQRQDFFGEGFKFMDVFEHVALVQVEENSG